MGKWIGLAANWIPLIVSLAANVLALAYFLLRPIETRRRLTFFCGRPWRRGVKDFRIILGLFEPDTERNERPNDRVLLVDRANRKILEPSGRCTLTGTPQDPHAPIRFTREGVPEGQLIPTASKAWVSHKEAPGALTEESKAAGRSGRVVISEDNALWRYAPESSPKGLQTRWQMLVPLFSPFLSWDDVNAAKAVADVLPDKHVRTTLHTSFDFSCRVDIHDNPVLYVGAPRSNPHLESILTSRNIVIAIAQDRVARGEARHIKIGGKVVCELTPELEDERVAVVARIHRGKDAGVCTLVCGCSARITQEAGEHLAAHWKELWRLAKQKKKGCKSFMAVLRKSKHDRAFRGRPDVIPLPEHAP
jgi:hypothetical protein